MNRDIAIATLCLHGFIPSWSGTGYVIGNNARHQGYWIERRPYPLLRQSNRSNFWEVDWCNFDTDDLVQLAQSKRVLHGADNEP